MPISLSDLEHTCRMIGEAIGSVLAEQHGKSQVGFALLLFDFGDGGHLTYLSNANRLDMIKALYECAAMLGAGADQPPLASGKREHKG
mgnify:CR=1 FL=1